MPNGRCKLHGGKSTGPRTPEGLERSRRANWKHGHFSREAKAERSPSERQYLRSAICATRSKAPPRSHGRIRTTGKVARASARAEVAIAMLKRRVAPHQAEGWSNPRAWTILDARGRSPNVRSSSQPTVRPRSRGSLPRLPYVRIAYIVAEVALVAPELMSHPARSHIIAPGGGR
jgi:hypothetical protein